MKTRLATLALASASALALAGCGFHPLYAEVDGKPGAQARFANVYIPPITFEGAGYELRNDLLDILQAKDQPPGALYDLRINLQDKNQPIAIQSETVHTIKEVEITRYNYTLIADYQLVDRKTQKVVTKGRETSISGYDVVPSPYATLVGQQDVQAHCADDIAHHLQLRLAVFFRETMSDSAR